MRIVRVITVVFLFASSLLNAQMNEVVIKTEKITDNIYMLKGRGGNIAIYVGYEEVFMIDDQFAPLSSKIIKAIKNITSKPIKYLVNTHWHGDHTGGNLNMQKEGATIVSHTNVRKRMSEAKVIRGKKRPASPKKALPIITFTKDLNFYIDDEEILVAHIHNAHTDGDAIIYFTKSNILHVGDAYFQGKFPYIDLNSGGSILGYIKGIEKMLMLADEDTKIIPGHGNVSNKKELRVYLKMLQDLTSKIKEAINKGKTIEEVKNNTTITEKYKEFSGWISESKIKETIYKSLLK